jgi:methylglutaconyl-CoA hydratase
MVLTGRKVSGVEAYFMGLCARLVEMLREEQEKGGGESEGARCEYPACTDVCEWGPVALAQAMRSLSGWK